MCHGKNIRDMVGRKKTLKNTLDIEQMSVTFVHLFPITIMLKLRDFYVTLNYISQWIIDSHSFVMSNK